MNTLLLTLLTVASQDALPTAVEIRAYYLDKDGKPAAAKDVKAAVVFEAPDGKIRTYPMTWTEPKNDDKAPICRYYTISGTDYRFAVAGTMSDASVPGGNTHYDKPFIKDLPVPIEPDPKHDRETDPQRDQTLNRSGYFRTFLGRKEIEDIAKGPFTDVSIVFTIKGDVRKTKCFNCNDGSIGAPCGRIGDDLRSLETLVQAGEWDKAKGTVVRIKESVNALPAKGKDDCVSCCSDLEAAVKAEKKDKALKEIHKLQEKCEACDASPSEPKKK